MATPWLDFKALRQKLRFEDVLRYYKIEVKADKPQFLCSCPLPTHRGDRSSPSFSANLQKGIFQCFSCRAKGNLLDFAVLMEGCLPDDTKKFREIAQKLAEHFNLSLGTPPLQPAELPFEKSPNESTRFVNAPLDFALKHVDGNHPYLIDWGFTPETIAHFGLGFCSRGFFKDRLVIPLHDDSGNLIGYGGRMIGDEPVTAEDPKYLFPSEREHKGSLYAFEKERFLYNGWKVIAPVDNLIIAQGFVALWWCHQAGISPVVSTMGENVSEEQSSLILKKLTPEGVLWIFGHGGESEERHASELLKKVAGSRAVRFVSTKGKKPTAYSKGELRKLFSFQKETKGAAVLSIKTRLVRRELSERQAIVELSSKLPVLSFLRISADTWNPDEFDKVASKLSSGERSVLQFLLHVWNPLHAWQAGRFEIGSLHSWDKKHRQIFAEWASDPWWC